MNDRYLFRGKRIDGGWVTGSWYGGSDECGSFLYIIPHTALPSQTDTIEFTMYLIDPTTIGQCTGFRDENGVLIFEGDVVTYGGGEQDYKFNSWVVVWNERYGGRYELENIQTKHTQTRPCISRMGHEERERLTIIGNIHDNPEATT